MNWRPSEECNFKEKGVVSRGRGGWMGVVVSVLMRSSDPDEKIFMEAVRMKVRLECVLGRMGGEEVKTTTTGNYFIYF